VTLGTDPFVMKVEVLEDMAMGFSTAFNEDSYVKISA